MKRKLEREIENLKDEVLAELGPRERLESVIRQLAAEKPRQVERLEESAPRETVKVRDPDYVVERLVARRFADRFVLELNTLRWRFYYAYLADQLVAGSHDDDGNQPDSDPRPGVALWDLADKRLAYMEFVDEEFDLDLEEFVAQVDGGPEILLAVDQIIHEHRQLMRDSVFKVAEDRMQNQEESDSETGE